MRIIDLQATPNQSFSVTLDGNRWDFVIKQAVGCMICDLTLNDELILSGQRILGSSPIIPYRHLQQNGNFLLLSDGDEIPFWDRFDIDQQLVYLSYNEIIAIPVPDPDRPVFVPYQRNQIIINSLAFVI